MELKTIQPEFSTQAQDEKGERHLYEKYCPLFPDKGVSTPLRPPAYLLPLWLDWRQFRKALERSLAFCSALFSETGEIQIAAAERRVSSNQEITLSFDCCAQIPLGLDEEWEQQPFIRINGYQTGLSLVLVDELLQQYSGKLSFHRKSRKQGFLKMCFRPVSGENGEPYDSGEI